MFRLKATEDIRTGQVLASDIFKGGTVCRRATQEDIGCCIGMAARDIKKGNSVRWDCLNNTKDVKVHG